MENSSLAPQKCLAMWGNFLPVLRPSCKDEVIDGAIHQVMFYGALNDVQFSIRKLDMLGIVGNWDGGGS